ncbi:MAG: hypothetical protein QF897_05575 [Gammaproteobacteria bacterium]|jgi:hypothetical protein|nr:hypothetical protein [Chromatiales bacterium]MDP7153900.1 hypothetical protein [Gammaproteobacteria bacterium]MDP7297491.1 hypothetical protein [Gammaproteobacteria bacterium]HJP03850.1 hypothetical protein [Gammaproteobacteria bacterium]
MSATNYFANAAYGGPGWLKWFILGVIVLGIGVGVLFFSERAKHDPNVHSPKVAWIRAWVYYCFILVISWMSGALGYVISNPLIAPGRTDDTTWLIVVSVCWLVSVWAYVYWWPRGTLTHGRKLHLLPTIIHGVMWGICAGLLYLSMYAALEQFGFPGIVNALILIGILSSYNINYQVGWWDIYVSPPHNIRATNNGKVALAHQPFLLASLTLLVMYGDGGMFVLLSTFALTCSAIALRFPPFWESDGGPVSRDTAMGE